MYQSSQRITFSALYQSSRTLTDGCPASHADCCDPAMLGSELIPGRARSLDHIVVVTEHSVREIGLTRALPDVLSRVEFGACRRQVQEADVCRNLQLAGCVPAGLCEGENGGGGGGHD